MEEIWKPIPGYEDLYEVSNIGQIRRTNYRGTGKPRLLKTKNCNVGYKHVSLCKNGESKCFTVHYLVYSTFNGKVPTGFQINHINEDKGDNRVENLNLMTPKENINWGTAIARRSKNKSKSICAIDKNTLEEIKVFTSSIEASKWLKNDNAHKHINSCLKGNRQSAYGYKWKYV